MTTQRANALVKIVTSPDGSPPLQLRLSIAQTGGYINDGKIKRGVYTRIWAIAEGGAGGYALAVVDGALPAGMGAMNPATGESYGTPTTRGPVEFTVEVQDSASTVAQQRFRVEVIGTLVALDAAPVIGEVGIAYSYQFRAGGNTGAVTWSLRAGTLPAGLTLSSAGLLAGTPAGSDGISYFTLRAVDTATGDTLDVAVVQRIYPRLTFTALLPEAPMIGNFPVGESAAHPVDICWRGGVPPYTCSALNSGGGPIPSIPNAQLRRLRPDGRWALFATAVAPSPDHGGAKGFFTVTDSLGATSIAYFDFTASWPSGTLYANKAGDASMPSVSKITFAGDLIESVETDPGGRWIVTINMPTDVPHNASAYQVGGTKVVGARDTGWGGSTGFANKGAWSIYMSPGTIASTYSATVASQLTTALAHIQVLSQRLAALQAALTNHGLIGP